MTTAFQRRSAFGGLLAGIGQGLLTQQERDREDLKAWRADLKAEALAKREQALEIAREQRQARFEAEAATVRYNRDLALQDRRIQADQDMEAFKQAGRIDQDAGAYRSDIGLERERQSGRLELERLKQEGVTAGASNGRGRTSGFKSEFTGKVSNAIDDHFKDPQSKTVLPENRPRVQKARTLAGRLERQGFPPDQVMTIAIGLAEQGDERQSMELSVEQARKRIDAEDPPAWYSFVPGLSGTRLQGAERERAIVDEAQRIYDTANRARRVVEGLSQPGKPTGIGTPEKPFQVTTAPQRRWVERYARGFYVQTPDGNVAIQPDPASRASRPAPAPRQPSPPPATPQRFPAARSAAQSPNQLPREDDEQRSQQSREPQEPGVSIPRGSGTRLDPFEIETDEHAQWLSRQPLGMWYRVDGQVRQTR